MSSGNVDKKEITTFPDFITFKKKIKIHLNHELIQDDNLNIANQIHLFLKNSQNLSQQQKYAYCNSQRFYMKLYLKEISKNSIK